ncbi:MAG: Rne/Rng family ribonuclease [Alphaproteobacteria bacterium]|nr:Rne/Rng family ribonuclease [Alphaproteobacteria bacterium]
MTTRMLIDATHAEETRIVVVDGKRLVDFDFESATKRQLKGNIYLAKVTRVEPSLQAAFVDYGGNRHGFLSFNEIHPDYYQIPVADREALLLDEAEEAARQAALEDRVDGSGADDDDADDADDVIDGAADGGPDSEFGSTAEAAPAGDDQESDSDDDSPEASEEAGAIDAMDEVPRPRGRSRRSYKIQEVIKRRQILLIQVVKEERGNKGAALTTYLSLAGRYCVLMPNTARGGGISRKIASQTHRRKLKGIVSELDVPEGMGVIVRTAGQSRTKAEIRRDFEYLLRLWDSVRDLTLDSTAPTVVYEEADLIKRAIRDMYAKGIDEILVDGEDGYRVAKDFMRMLMPSHAKKVQPYRDRIPLLHRYQVEQQLDSMHSNVVQLKSGGYLVFAQTEALVAVDVNSGRSTKERNVEETALKTNLEAADEVGRQLRLRDLAGLVVIDYIDMDENRNNRAVESRMKEALKDDRARIQVGRISSFGLMELSRQRLRPGLFEASTKICEICGGTGFVRTTESTSLHVLRTIEEEGIRGRAAQLTVHAPAEVALYLLNQKRDHLAEIQLRYGMQVYILGDETLVAPDCRVTIDQTRTAEEVEEIENERRRTAALQAVSDDDDDDIVEDIDDDAAEASAEAEAEADGEEDGEKPKERRPRRRRRSRSRGEGRKSGETGDSLEAGDTTADTAAPGEDGAEEGSGSLPTDANGSDEEGSDGEEKTRRRRRGRRGGRRRRTSGEETDQATDQAEDQTADQAGNNGGTETAEPTETAAPIGFGASGMVMRESPAVAETQGNAGHEAAANDDALPTSVSFTPEPTQIEPAIPEPIIPEPAAAAEPVAATVADAGEEKADDVEKPRRRGWWQRGRLF